MRRARNPLPWSVAVLLAALQGRAAPPAPPGVVIAHSPAASRVYLGTPGIAVLPDGAYLAKHDEFGPGSTEHEVGVTHVYRSTDLGASWQRASTVRGMYWAGIFYADWHFDGDDLIAAVRTAFDDATGGAPNQHDANFLTFHRVPRFRELTLIDSAPGAPRE